MIRKGSGSFALFVGLVAVVGSFVVPLRPTVEAQTSPFPVQDTYGAAGPHAVTKDAWVSYVIYRPTTLSTTSKHPVITWGNGTFGTCDNGEPSLRHLASWGYVVVCANNGLTGSGDPVLAGATYMVGENANPASIYYQRLDTTKIASAGTSQGACGAVRAAEKSNGLIKSTLAHVYVDSFWASIACGFGEPAWDKLTAPLFFFRATNDLLTSDAETTRKYNLISTAPVAKAANVGGSFHGLDAVWNPYMVAWFKYTLEGDPLARTAFVETNGQAPELVRNTGFTEFAGKRLP